MAKGFEDWTTRDLKLYRRELVNKIHAEQERLRRQSEIIARASEALKALVDDLDNVEAVMVRRFEY
jgi:hypothetical protein